MAANGDEEIALLTAEKEGTAPRTSYRFLAPFIAYVRHR